jgi:hypothetical protein
MTRARKHELEHVPDEDIRIELQRRVEEVPAPVFVGDFADLPPGAWGRPEDADELNKPEMRAAWTTIARLSHRLTGSEFLGRFSNPQNNQLNHSGQDIKRPRKTHICAPAAHNLYIEPATVLRATAEPAA